VTEVLVAPVCACCRYPLGVPRVVTWINREGDWQGGALELTFTEREIETGRAHALMLPPAEARRHNRMQFETITLELFPYLDEHS
jgi:hypothetical protein